MAGNTADSTTLRDFLDRIERQYGKARRIWVMDRGIPTEAVLEIMRQADPPVSYVVGTPKGRLNRLEQQLLTRPWHEARPGVQVKLLPQDGELYVFAQSADRVAKERAMRRRQLKWLWARLKQLSAMRLTREELLMKLGAARHKAPTAWRLIKIEVSATSAMFSYRLDRNKLRVARRREGRYLLRTNLTEHDSAKLWTYYLQLVAVEEVFKNLKGDLAIRPIFHQEQERIEAHIFIAFLAYCLHVTLRRRLHALAPGDPAQRAREVRRHAHDRRPRPDHRRARATAHTPHPAGARAASDARHAQARTAGPAAAENHRRGGRAPNTHVVQTFRAAPVMNQLLRVFAPLQSAKSG
jgi:transposase